MKDNFDKNKRIGTTIALLMFAAILAFGGYYIFGPNGFLGGTLFKAQVKVINADQDVTVYVGDTKNLDVKPADKVLKYESLNKNIVTVDSKGNVVGKKVGTAVVRVYEREKSYIDINVTVKKVINANSLTLNKHDIDLKVGDIYYLKVSFEPNNTTQKDLKWESSDNNVASVKNGKIEALNEGSIIINVYNQDNIMDTCTVNITK